MNTNYEFSLMQLADSFFPSGMFSMSNGVESFVRRGKIKNTDDVLTFIRRQIKFQILPCDCAIFLISYDAVHNNEISQVVEADNLLYSIKLIKEIRNASTRSGTQLLNCVIEMATNNTECKFARKFQEKIQKKEAVGTYPVCLGIAANCLKIPKESGLRMMLYSFSQSIVGAVIRLGIIEHVNGQKILAQLADEINVISENLKPKSINELWQLTPSTDIFQMFHEHDDSKMFIT